jgi:hypothetical protein
MGVLYIQSVGKSTYNRLSWRGALVAFSFTTSVLAGDPAAGQVPVDAKITAPERAGLQVTQDSIRHPFFGFALPRPSPAFTPNAGLQRIFDEQLSQQPNEVVWVFGDTVSRQVLTVLVHKMVQVDQAHFRDFVQGIRKGAAKATVVRDTLTWDGPRQEYELILEEPSGLYLNVRCLPGKRSQIQFVVCLSTITPHQGDLDSVRANLTVVP